MTLSTAAELGIGRGLTARIDAAMGTYSPIYDRICRTRPSSGFDEKYGFAGQVEGLRPLIGEIAYQRLGAASFTLENQEFAHGIEFEAQNLSDDRIGIYDQVPEKFGLSAARHPDELMLDMLNDADNLPCWDGQGFLDTDHSWGKSGAQSNLLSGGVYNIADADDPTEAEARIIFESMFDAIANFVGDNGKKMIGPVVTQINDLELWVPTIRYKQVFSKALYAAFDGSGASNLVSFKPANIEYIPGLSDANRIILFRSGGADKPLIYQDREKFRTWKENFGDPDPTKLRKIGGYARRAIGFFAWWNLVAADLS